VYSVHFTQLTLHVVHKSKSNNNGENITFLYRHSFLLFTHKMYKHILFYTFCCFIYTRISIKKKTHFSGLFFGFKRVSKTVVAWHGRQLTSITIFTESTPKETNFFLVKKKKQTSHWKMNEFRYYGQKAPPRDVCVCSLSCK